MIWQDDEELEEDVVAWDVVIVVTIIKVNDYTRVETEDM